MEKHVHISLIMTYKLLSSLHKRVHQQCGHVHLLSYSQVSWTISGERKRITHHHILVFKPRSTWSKTRLDQVSPKHIQRPQNTSRVLSTKVQDQGSTHALSKGSQEHIQGLISTTKEHIQGSIQAPGKDSLEHIQEPQNTSRDLLLGP